MNHITLNEKLILYFILLGLGTICIISVYSFYSTQDALLNRTFDQLTSLKIAKKNQVEIFFHDRIKEATLLASSDETRKISVSLDRIPEAECRKEITAYLTRFRSLTGYFTSVMIVSQKGRYVRGYTSGQPGVSGLIRRKDTGKSDVVTVAGVTLHDMKIDPDTRKVKMVMEAEIPDSEGGRIIIELSNIQINTIMLNKDPNNGLGMTGETYLVGSDYKMRSGSRFIRNSILRTTVMTKPVVMAVKGKEGNSFSRDYRYIQVLSSCSKLKITGLNWFIIAEIDLKEAMVPIIRMRNSILLLSTFIFLTYFVFVFIIARMITRPIMRLKEAAVSVGSGKYDIDIPVRSNDEIGSLTEAFNSMSAQIKEKTEELESERIGRLRYVIDGEEKERRRLSQEIHDGIGQSLIAHKLRLESLLYMEDSEIRGNITLLKDQFGVTIEEVRRISNNLMPSVLEVFGITLALKNLCDRTEEHGGPVVLFKTTGNLEEMNSRTKTYLYRIAQEGMNNILKHSAAAEVTFTLTRSGGVLMMMLRDDGRGFQMQDSAFEKGNGLHNMRERVALLEGSINIISSQGEGTAIFINIPVN